MTSVWRRFEEEDILKHIGNNEIYNNAFYIAITQNNFFVKGSHKYDVYLVEETKAHLNWPNKDRIAIFD